MRLLIYGAGVIGSLYAALFAQAGFDTALYARGKRLQSLQESGLLFLQKGKVHKASVHILGALADSDRYDFIFLAVRETQAHAALAELSGNVSPNIVTMVNTLEDYSAWEDICGRSRLLPAFPGAGGGFEKGILKAALTPRLVQPTTFGEISGKMTERARMLAGVFRQSGIPYQIVPDMHVWQLCHLAMVVPLGDAYIAAAAPERIWEDKAVAKETARALKQNFKDLHKLGIRLSPPKMNIFRFLPHPLLAAALSGIFRTKFADMFMYQHAVKAPDEMRELHKQFHLYILKRKQP